MVETASDFGGFSASTSAEAPPGAGDCVPACPSLACRSLNSLTAPGLASGPSTPALNFSPQVLHSVFMPPGPMRQTGRSSLPHPSQGLPDVDRLPRLRELVPGRRARGAALAMAASMPSNDMGISNVMVGEGARRFLVGAASGAGEPKSSLILDPAT